MYAFKTYSLTTKGQVEMTSFKVEIINNMKQFAFLNW